MRSCVSVWNGCTTNKADMDMEMCAGWRVVFAQDACSSALHTHDSTALPIPIDRAAAVGMKTALLNTVSLS
ncbi:unnamed protein product [Toxocara canis]|uniref:GMC_oxred_C domain-containing protein n=1 Tax=Toxocara canis TaxID=6265 RepID=A0A183UM49_TOXCA|nr:unnamed protein product [Toxocara canis]